MNIFGELTRAQAEILSVDPSTLIGRVFFNSTDSQLKYSTASAIKTIVDTDTAQTLSNKTAAGLTMTGNIAMANYQLTSMRVENIAAAPAAGNAGRVIFNTTSGLLMMDDGLIWTNLSLASASSPTLANVLGYGNSAPAASMTIGSITLNGGTASRALYLDGSKVLTASATTATELGYLSGVTSAVQTQINSLSSSITTILSGNPTLAGNVTFKAGGATNVVQITNFSLNILEGDYLNFWDNTNTHKVGLFAPAAVTADYNLTLPATQGAANSFIRNDGAGALTFVVAASANTASALVQRDGSGNFSAGTISANLTGYVLGQHHDFIEETTPSSPSAGNTRIFFSSVDHRAMTVNSSGTVIPLDGLSAEYDAGNSGATKTIDHANGLAQKLTMTASCTLTLSNPINGRVLILKLIQGGAGSYTMTWPAAVKWPAGTAPTLSTTVGKIDVISLYYDGTNYYGSSGLGY